ncbi:MAG TPA: GHMP kinase, partial [Patescibacteria group bacterium]
MIITQTPLRISFVGGGTDIAEFYQNYGGAVISTAINKYVYVIVKERFDEMIYLNWMKKEIVSRVDDIEHELIREAMKKTGVIKGVEITTLSDIPAEGSGLGSSSSVTVSLLQALYQYKGEIVDAERLASEACQIEIEILKKPIGKQDQYIAAYGGLKHFSFHQNGQVTVSRPNISDEVINELNQKLLLFFTGKTRKSSEVLTEQKKKMIDKSAIMQRMRDQSYEVLSALEKGHVAFLGKALDEGWQLKKQLAGGISSPEIDLMYKRSKRAGALGGKIAGAGGGGFLLLYVPLEKQTAVRAALKNYRE